MESKKGKNLGYQFAAVPHDLIKDEKISGEAKSVYMVLLAFAMDGVATVSMSTIKACSGRGNDSINKGIAELIKCRYISKESGKQTYKPNTYIFNFDDETWSSFNDKAHRENYVKKVMSTPATVDNIEELKEYVEFKETQLQKYEDKYKTADSPSKGGIKARYNETKAQVESAKIRLHRVELVNTWGEYYKLEDKKKKMSNEEIFTSQILKQLNNLREKGLELEKKDLDVFEEYTPSLMIGDNDDEHREFWIKKANE